MKQQWPHLMKLLFSLLFTYFCVSENELKLKVCASIAYWLFDLKSTVMVYRGKAINCIFVQILSELI